MLRLSLRSILLVFLSATAANNVLAQSPGAAPAPIERRAPQPTGVSAWPLAGSVKTGTHLLITTNSGPQAFYDCKLESITPEAINCSHRFNHPALAFDRASIETIMLPPRHQFLASTVLFLTGAGILLVDLIAVRAGASGDALGDSALVGLYLLFGGSIARYVETFHGPNQPTPLYIAPSPYPTALPSY